MEIFNKKIEEEKEEERFILCLDGGGMRGIIPSVLLDKLAHLVKAYDDTKPFYSHFDLIAGTSTGGLLALAMTTPPQYLNIEKEEGEDIEIKFEIPKQSFIDKVKRKPLPKKKDDILIPRGSDCSKLISIYKENGSKIFPAQTRLFGQLLRDKYRAEPLEDFLKSFFNDSKLSQCLVPTMVVSYEIQEGKPYTFKSWDSKDFYIKEAARATSAAPTYFPPVILHERTTEKKLTLVDGAMVANNPIIIAYGEAQKLYPNCKKFHILSLSTASIMFGFGDEEFTGGVMGWIDPSKGAPIQKIYASSQMQMADYVAENNSDIEYTRVDYSFENDTFKLDDTSSYAISKLEESGNIVYEKNEEKIIDYVEKLINKKDFSQITTQEWITKEANKNIKEYKKESYVPEPVEDTSQKDLLDADTVIDSLTHVAEKVKDSKNSRLSFFRNIKRKPKEPIDNSRLLPSATSENTIDLIDKVDTISDNLRD
jgi:predicted acylesterase/phospholipase RssA